MIDRLGHSRLKVWLVVLQLMLIGVTGCAPAGKPQGKIRGKVTFQGKPVSSGEVNFFQKSTGVAVVAPLDNEGRFTVTSPMDTGLYNVSIVPPRPKQLPPGTPPEQLPPFPVPPKYLDPVQSDLNKEIKAGDNDLEIAIPG